MRSRRSEGGGTAESVEIEKQVSWQFIIDVTHRGDEMKWRGKANPEGS